MWENLPLWPVRAATFSGRVDALFIFLIAVTGGVTLLVVFTVAFFMLRYRHSRHPQARQVEGSIPLEITWSVIPLGIFMLFFLWGATIYYAEARPPKDAMEVFVVGKQWMWKTQHQTGQREINELHVPAGRDVRLTMISQDVIHSFFIPAFRIKQDVLPGRYTTIWFNASKPGDYHLFCAEYCGTQHSGMIGHIIVMEPQAFEAWLANGSAEGSLANTGQKLFQELGCATCHRFDTQGRGPNLLGVYGKPVLLSTGQTVIADDNYVRESITNPAGKVVAGFQPIMPTFSGIVSEDQLIALIAYVRSLSEAAGTNVNRPVVPNTSAPASGNSAGAAGPETPGTGVKNAPMQ